MCAVDFLHELGEAAGGNTIYPSEKSAIENSPCVKSCGLVKVKIVEVKQILPSTFDNCKTSEEWEEYNKSDEYRSHLLDRIDHLEDQLSFLYKLYKKSKGD
jgi:hypothetical protein